MGILMPYAKEFSKRMRARRFELFAEFVRTMPRPIKILDLGGTNTFWENCGWAGSDECHVTICNLVLEEQKHSNVVPCQGDATDMSRYNDGSFDLVFSNSVIEHVFTLEKQVAMANEVRRLGRAYWIQTPNYWFPMEPHFHFIGWQWLPESLRIGILRRRNCGWRGRTRDREKASELVREVRLLSKRELRRLFPDGRFEAERFAGLVKSWIVFRG